MKHIGFDESTVLSEYARIANELGLVKTAEEDKDKDKKKKKEGDEPKDEDKKDEEESEDDEKDQDADGPKLQGLTPMPKTLEEAMRLPPGPMRDSHVKRLMSGSGKFKVDGPPAAPASPLGDAMKGVKAPLSTPPLAGPRDMGPAAAPKSRTVAPIQTKPNAPNIDLGPKKDIPVVNPGKTSSRKDELAKEADGKIYDVSGETGEQLVDSAHPGGGTRTELSHSKTDENLVETIVEQQARDLEVARSVPKGTYAALVTLHEKLEKMGYKEILAPLKSAIDKVATTDLIITHNLTTLANKLDSKGYVDAANHVDMLLALAGPAEHAKMLAQSLPAWPAAGGGAGRAPGAIMSRLGPAASKVGGAAAGIGGLALKALPWLASPALGIGIAGGATVGIAAYFIGKDLFYMSGTLDNLIDRFGDLDPNEQAAPVVNQWVGELNRLKGKLTIPKASIDAETQKQIVQQRAKDTQEIAQSLSALQQQWASDIKPNLTDWGFDASQAEQVLNNTVTKFTQMAAQVAAKAGQAGKAADQQKAVEKQEEVAKKTGPAKPGEGPAKKKTIFNDYARSRRFAKRFNYALRDIDAEHRNKIRWDREADATKTVTPMVKGDLQKALTRVRDAGGWVKFEEAMDKIRAGGGDVREGFEDAEQKDMKGTNMDAPADEEGRFMKLEYVRNRIADKIMERFKKAGYGVEKVDTQKLYEMAQQTAKNNMDTKNLTPDDEGQRRLESFLADIVNHPNFATKAKSILKK